MMAVRLGHADAGRRMRVVAGGSEAGPCRPDGHPGGRHIDFRALGRPLPPSRVAGRPHLQTCFDKQSLIRLTDSENHGGGSRPVGGCRDHGTRIDPGIRPAARVHHSRPRRTVDVAGGRPGRPGPCSSLAGRFRECCTAFSIVLTVNQGEQPKTGRPHQQSSRLAVLGWEQGRFASAPDRPSRTGHQPVLVMSSRWSWGWGSLAKREDGRGSVRIADGGPVPGWTVALDHGIPRCGFPAFSASAHRLEVALGVGWGSGGWTTTAGFSKLLHPADKPAAARARDRRKMWVEIHADMPQGLGHGDTALGRALGDGLSHSPAGDDRDVEADGPW